MTTVGGAVGVVKSTKMPLYSLACAVVFVVVAAVLLLTGKSGNTLFPVIVAAIPSLLAASFAEHNGRALHNGVITEKVKDALNETQVVTRDGPTVNATLQALTAILEELHPETVNKLPDALRSENARPPTQQDAHKEGHKS